MFGTERLYFSILNEKIYFGPYPNKQLLNRLKKKEEITTIIDLTTPREILKKDRYIASDFGFEQYKFSIPDRKFPSNILKFKTFITSLLNLYFRGKKIYIHCRGGHGRVGIVSIILIQRIKNLSVEDAIKYVKDIHSKRKNLKPKIIKWGIPQTNAQKQFIKDYFSDDVYFYNKGRIYYELSNFYPSKITIDEKVYPSVEHYYQSQKFVYKSNSSKEYKEYVNIIMKQTTSGKAFYLGRRIKRKQYKWMNPLNDIIDKYSVEIDPNWEKKKIDIMKKGIHAKFTQIPLLRKVLSSTYKGDIYEDSPRDSFWGLGSDGKGKNMLGKLLVELRNEVINKNPKIFVVAVYHVRYGTERWWRPTPKGILDVLEEHCDWMSQRELDVYSITFEKKGLTCYCNGYDVYGDDYDNDQKCKIPKDTLKKMKDDVKKYNFDHEVGNGQLYECKNCDVIYPFMQKCNYCNKEDLDEVEM